MGIFGLNFFSIYKPIIEVRSSKFLIRTRTSWSFVSNFQEMEGINFITMVFFLLLPWWVATSLVGTILCMSCAYDLSLVYSSSDSCLISSFACITTLNFLGQPTKCFCTMLWVSFSCATYFNKSTSCYNMLKCSSFVMGLNNHVNIFCHFCWMPI
jgi:hypothetical protein